MDQQALTELTQEIMLQGHDEATASRYAVILGDTPILDEAGNVLVMDGDRQIAKLQPLAFYGLGGA